MSNENFFSKNAFRLFYDKESDSWKVVKEGHDYTTLGISLRVLRDQFEQRFNEIAQETPLNYEKARAYEMLVEELDEALKEGEG